MFIGRHAELAELNKLYAMKGFKFVVVYSTKRRQAGWPPGAISLMDRQADICKTDLK